MITQSSTSRMMCLVCLIRRAICPAAWWGRKPIPILTTGPPLTSWNVFATLHQGWQQLGGPFAGHRSLIRT